MKQLVTKLMISLIIFTIIIITATALYNRQLLIKNIQEEQKESWKLVQGHIISDMQTVDKAHLYFDSTYSTIMEEELNNLRKYYDVNPDFTAWNIEEIKQRTEMEFYLIDENNKIVLTTHPQSLGLDFNECCENFASLLNERRMSDEFYSDGLDNSAVTKELWKYSYLSTSDHKYILELGVKMNESLLYLAFNFFDTIEQLLERYKDLKAIRVISHEGFFLESNDEMESVNDFSPKLLEAYNQTFSTNEPLEVVEHLSNNRTLTSRFIPYEAENARGQSTKRIVYFQFSNDGELEMLSSNTKDILYALAIGILISLILLAIIIKMLLSTIRLATYDTLTGIYNRASYLDYVDKSLKNQAQHPVGLLLIDLDNFKQVNDTYGHAEGDNVLKQFADLLKEVSKSHYPVRFGGDEFAIVLSKANEDKLAKYAQNLLAAVHKKQQQSEVWQHLSVSIGGAYEQKEKETEVSLFMRADKALYDSKNAGKDQYTFEALVE